jgi:hypothetical protein
LDEMESIGYNGLRKISCQCIRTTMKYTQKAIEKNSFKDEAILNQYNITSSGYEAG